MKKTDKVKKLPEVANLNPVEIDYLLGLLVLYEERLDIVQQEFLENTRSGDQKGKKLSITQIKQIQAKYEDRFGDLQKRPELDGVPTARDSFLNKLMYRVIKMSMQVQPRYSIGRDSDGGTITHDGWDMKSIIEATKVCQKINESRRNFLINKAKIELLSKQEIEDFEELDNLISLEDGLDHLRAKRKEKAENGK